MRSFAEFTPASVASSSEETVVMAALAEQAEHPQIGGQAGDRGLGDGARVGGPASSRDARSTALA